MQKINSDREIAGLKQDSEELKATVAELQGKLDSISNIADTGKNDNKYSETEVKDCIQKYLNLKGIFYGSTEEMLGEDGLGFNENEYNGINSEKNKEFIKTKIIYSDFKNKMYEYMTEKCIEDEYGEYFIEEDGYLCYRVRGATGAKYTLESFTKNDNKYIAKVDFSQDENDHSDCEFEFELVYYNGKLVVDYCTQTT